MRRRKSEKPLVAATPDQFLKLAATLDPTQLRDQTIAKLVQRHLAGGVLTEKQQKLIEDWRQKKLEPESAPAQAAPPEWVGSSAQLAEILGCHEKSIPRWLREFKQPGLKRSNGGYHVPSWQKLFAEHGLGSSAAAEASEPRLAELRLKQEVEKLHRLQRENRIEDGKYIPVETAARIFKEAHEHMKNLSREVWEEQMPPQLAGLTAAAIRALARQANDRLCAAMLEYAAKLEIQP